MYVPLLVGPNWDVANPYVGGLKAFRSLVHDFEKLVEQDRLAWEMAGCGDDAGYSASSSAVGESGRLIRSSSVDVQYIGIFIVHI
mgnify:CR=1 FL=1